MDCTLCSLKGCRKFSPCSDKSEEYIDEYLNDENTRYIKSASALVDNGRAGKLNRLEEIIEYSRLMGYKKIGVAYCYGIEKDAAALRERLTKEGFKAVMVSCTVDGISETRIDKDKTKEVVSCNPLGQANAINRSNVDFTILMGLCLGHDIMLQKKLNMDFTTFVVKDRALKHNPILALKDGKGPEDEFIENLPGDFCLIKGEELIEKLKDRSFAENTYILDLRSREEYTKGSIKGSVNCLLQELPGSLAELLPDKKKEVIVYCNGGIQSIYAVMYLAQKGYGKVRSLAGGYSRIREFLGQ